jgi:hypothetical protein
VEETRGRRRDMEADRNRIVVDLHYRLEECGVFMAECKLDPRGEVEVEGDDKAKAASSNKDQGYKRSPPALRETKCIYLPFLAKCL